MRTHFTPALASAVAAAAAMLAVAPSAHASASVSYSTAGSAFTPGTAGISALGDLDPAQAGTSSFLTVLFEPETASTNIPSDILLGKFEVAVGDSGTSVIGKSATAFDLALSQTKPLAGSPVNDGATITTDVAFTTPKHGNPSDKGSSISIQFAQPTIQVGGIVYTLGTGTGGNFTPLPSGVLTLDVPEAGKTATTDLRAEVLSDPEPATIVSASIAVLMGLGFASRRRKPAAA